MGKAGVVRLGSWERWKVGEVRKLGKVGGW